LSESFEIDGREMLKHACSVGLEGVVSKVRDSRYASGRSNDWVKTTCAQRETLPIAGFGAGRIRAPAYKKEAAN
jgi:bifunctional non-homologous end joining protein LigD